MAMDPFFGSLIGAGANLVGGLISSAGNRVANERASDLANNNLKFQSELATQGIRWKAADVMKAYEQTGIHPLMLLGTSAPTFSPVSASFVPDTSVGEAIGKAGQSIERGLYASADRDAREMAMGMTTAMNKLAIERGGLENELLRMKIASEAARLVQSPAVGLPSINRRYLVDGQNLNTELRSPVAQGPGIEEQPLKRVTPGPSDPSSEPGAVTSRGWLRNADNSWSPVKSADAQQRLEDDFWGTTKHFITNTLVPMFSPNSVPPPFPAPAGKSWYVDWKGDWRLVDRTDQMYRSRFGPGMRR